MLTVYLALSKKIFGDKPFTENSGYEIKRKLRVIPVRFGDVERILYGIKLDTVYTVAKNRRERLSLVVATDDKGDNYGGYSALLPASALEGVRYENS